MKFRKPLFFSAVIIAILGTLAFLPQIDPSEKEALLMRTILGISDNYHFDPESINDEFSEKVYDLYLDRLDRGRRWLTQEDVRVLEASKYQLDDQALSGNYDFFNASVQLLKAGIKRSQGFYQEILAEDFNYKIDESIEFDTDKKDFASNEEDLKDYWRQNLKYEVMTRFLDKLEEQKKAKEGDELLEKSEEDLMADAKKSVLKLYDDWYGRMEKLKRHDRLTTYLNCITNVFDPHTGYFEPIQKENFDIEFKGRLEGIGARLREDGDFTKVVEIVVGGPAWKGKELEEEDMILKVAQDDEEEQLDIKGMRTNEVVQHIRGKKGTKVRLTVKKPDGTIKEISIIRDIVVLEARFAKSLLLESPSEEKGKIGYIHLPGFYADFQDRSGRFSAADVEKEIDKLKKDKVEGIILDLRSNPGGSLEEVRKMSGLFIENGPVVQVKSRDQRPEVLADSDARVQYNGPLVVLVNSFSASASEILAAALQDYGRAVIVGSNSTYGKGTVQRFIDLDRMVRGNADAKPLGQLKLTMQKYYRINGGSVQLRGVVPDIILPDTYHFVDVGEKDYEHAMDWSDIPAVSYAQEVYQIDNMEQLKAMSKARVDGDATFQKVLENAEWVKEQREITKYPLAIATYQAFEEERNEASDLYKDLFKSEVLENVVNVTADLPVLKKADESKVARNEDFIKGVKKDIYIQEALNIMQDMIDTHGMAMNDDRMKKDK
ncbi:MAG: carboxy terminal-processing peptidase [Bacteroidota bacterium]